MSNLADVLSTGLAQIEERFVRLEINIAANAALLSAVLKRSQYCDAILADAEILLASEYSDSPGAFLELVRDRMHRLIGAEKKLVPPMPK